MKEIKKRLVKGTGKQGILTASALLMAALLTACASSGAANAEMYGSDSAGMSPAAKNSAYGVSRYEAGTETAVEESMDTAEAVAEETDMADGGTEVQQMADTGRKLIKNVNLSVETYEFETLLAQVEEQIASLGGYIEDLRTYNGSIQYNDTRNASITARIPREKLDGFVNAVGEEANITSRYESVEDVTLQYVDMDSHKKVLLVEQERLLAFLEQAETMEDIIAIESRLSEVRYQIESMESQLRTIDNQVDYSTVYLEIEEVKQYSAPAKMTAWEEITTGFLASLRNVGEGLRDLCIGFIVSIPYLIVLAVAAGLIFLVVYLCVKRAEKKKGERTATRAAGRWRRDAAAQQSADLQQSQQSVSLQQNEDKTREDTLQKGDQN